MIEKHISDISFGLDLPELKIPEGKENKKQEDEKLIEIWEQQQQQQQQETTATRTKQILLIQPCFSFTDILFNLRKM